MKNGTDDGVRADKGVLACLRQRGDGTSDLILDDVRADQESNPVSWTFEWFYTRKNLGDERLDSLSLTADQYREIGENLILRLLALNGRIAP